MKTTISYHNGHNTDSITFNEKLVIGRDGDLIVARKYGEITGGYLFCCQVSRLISISSDDGYVAHQDYVNELHDKIRCMHRSFYNDVNPYKGSPLEKEILEMLNQ